MLTGTGDTTSGAGRCPACGREYPGQVPRYCMSCGYLFESQTSARQQEVPVQQADLQAPVHNVVAPHAGAPYAPAGEPPSPPPPLPPRPAGGPAPARSATPVDRQADWRTKKVIRPKLLVTIISAMLVALLVVGAGAGLIVWLRSRKPSVPMPATAEAMVASVPEAEEYLTAEGKKLAAGRTRDLSIYSVTAKLDAVGNSIAGTERILYTNTTGTTINQVVLRVYANAADVKGKGNGATIDTVKVDGRTGSISFKGSLFNLGLPTPLSPGGKALLSFEFVESIPVVSSGFSLDMLTNQGTEAYGILGRGGNIFDLGYFIPTVAAYSQRGWESREAPSFGDIGDFDEAYWNVSIDVPKGYVVAAPGLYVGKASSGGRQCYDFRGGPLRDFTAQASPDYSKATTRVGETTVNSYYSKGATDLGAKALGFARDALKQYSSHFGAYPYKSFNVCEAPLGGGAGGMEFSGQVQIGQLLYGLSGASTGGVDMGDLLKSLSGGLMDDILEFTVAHEVCHQWWGLTVGSDPIEHPWQDESLTNYCSVMYFKWQHGAEAAKKQMDTQVMMNYSAAQLMGAGGDAIVDKPIYSFTNQAQYAAVVYSKGAFFYQELEKSMGDAAFEKSLRDYYAKYAFLRATPAGLMACFYQNSKDSAASVALHRRWIQETHADEDMASSDMPMMDLLNNLMKGLPNGGLDLKQLDEMLKDYLPEGMDLDDMMKQYLPDGSAPGLRLPGTAPVLPI